MPPEAAEAATGVALGFSDVQFRANLSEEVDGLVSERCGPGGAQNAAHPAGALIPVLMIVAIPTAEHPKFRSASQVELLNSDEPLLPTLGTNIRSVAASARIPRETVRRKIGELIDVGWLAWNRQSLCITAKAYRDLTPVREAVQRAAAGHFGTVDRLVARSDDPDETG